MNSPIFQSSADARLLRAEFATAQVGDTITDKQLSDAIGKRVDASFGPARTALHRLQRDEGMVFGRVMNTGWKRLDSSEIVNTGVRDVTKIRRAANRSIERQMKAEFERLSEPQKAQFTAQVSIMATVSMMSKPASVAKIQAAATNSTKRELPVSETLRMFTTGGK